MGDDPGRMSYRWRHGTSFTPAGQPHPPVQAQRRPASRYQRA